MLAKTKIFHTLNINHRHKYPNTIKRLGRDGSKSGASSWCSCHNWLNGFWDCRQLNNDPGISALYMSQNRKCNLHMLV
jgi:hypothetical protein